MDEAGLDIQVLSLNTPGLHGLPAEEASSLQVETNDCMADLMKAHPNRFQGFATLALPAPGAAARYNNRANDVAQANYVAFSQARIDSFIRLRPPLLSRDPALMSQYREMCRSRFFVRQLTLLQRALEDADTAIARLRLVRR